MHYDLCRVWCKFRTWTVISSESMLSFSLLTSIQSPSLARQELRCRSTFGLDRRYSDNAPSDMSGLIHRSIDVLFVL
jgi:hypothetical protein